LPFITHCPVDIRFIAAAHDFTPLSGLAGPVCGYSPLLEIIKGLRAQRDELAGLLKEIVENEDVQIFPSAIEGDPHTADFEAWAVRVKDALAKSEG